MRLPVPDALKRDDDRERRDCASAIALWIGREHPQLSIHAVYTIAFRITDRNNHVGKRGVIRLWGSDERSRSSFSDTVSKLLKYGAS